MTEIKKTTINLSHTKLLIRDDGIIQINPSDKTYDIEDIKEIHQAATELSLNQKIRLLLIASDFTSITNDALKYLSTQEAAINSIAKAFVIKSLAQRILINFLIKVKGTPVPVKFFNDIEPAVTWLKQSKL